MDPNRIASPGRTFSAERVMLFRSWPELLRITITSGSLAWENQSVAQPGVKALSKQPLRPRTLLG